jgi:predicted CoA-substrate-specific enzyme activase
MTHIVCGLDIGSLAAKGVLLRDGQFLAAKMLLTGADAPKSISILYADLLREVDLKETDIATVVATGYGRVSVPFADKTITEITCHARGITHFLPQTHTLIDLGGQDSKAIRIDPGGKVVDFVMNDKCAAGTGRFLEVMAHGLNFSLDELGEAARRAKNIVQISATCTVFAESEVIGMIARGTPRDEIARGVMTGIAQRVVAMAARMEIEGPVAMSGGVAKNLGMVEALERELGIKVTLPPEPQMIGAWGAALMAQT